MKDLRNAGLFAVVVMALGLTSFLSPSYAAITIAQDFEGSIVITYPDGNTEILNQGDAIPQIPSGATVTVLGGKANISTDAQGDQVKCNCLGADFDLGGASSVQLTCGDKSGSLEVLGGQVDALAGGESKKLQPGDKYPILSGDAQASAEPTAAGESLGVTPEGDTEPNSRDMAVSPGQ